MELLWPSVSGKQSRFLQNRAGFTLIEMVLVMGVVGMISTIVIVAINPTQQLSDARDAERKVAIRETENAAMQYAIDNWGTELGEGLVPTGDVNAKKICRSGVASSSECVNVDALVPTYITALPQDASETDVLVTGYRIYKDQIGKMHVCADHLGDGAALCAGAASAQESSASSSISSAQGSSSQQSSAASSSATETDITAIVTIARSGFIFTRNQNLWNQTDTVSNPTGSSIAGGFRFVLLNLTNATLSSARIGSTILTIDNADPSNPAIIIPSTVVAAMAPSASFSIALIFSGSIGVAISYDNQFLQNTSL